MHNSVSEMLEPHVCDVVSGLATAEAARVRKFRDAEDEETDRSERGLPLVPLLHLSRGLGGRWTVGSTGERGHPNEARMPAVRDWMERDVLALCGDVSGTYRLELHDSYTYLPRGDDYRDTLSFCRDAFTPMSVAVFPDPYQASGYAGLLGPADTVPWAAKRPTIVFAGATTGDTDPTKNKRVLACIWSLGHPRETCFRISAVVQMRPYDTLRRCPLLAEIIAPHLSPEAQFQNRFLANIMGNTACWSRVPMVLRSGCVLFHMPHRDMAWYYPVMRAGVHYVECATHDDLLLSRTACMADDAGCRRMTRDANAMYERYLTREAASSYAASLLSGIRGS